MDSILSVRISEEVKSKFLKLAEEQGVNNKEFLDLVIKSYEMNKTAADVDFVKNDIDELQIIIKRVIDIYLNMIDKNKVRSLELTNNFQANITEEQNKVDTFKNQVSTLKKDLENLLLDNKKLKDSVHELETQLMKEKEDLKEFKEMNSILKEKSVEYNSIKSSYEAMKDTNRALNNDIEKIKEERESLIKEIDRLKNSNSLLLDKLNTAESTNKVSITELRDSFNAKLQLKESEFNLKMQTQLLQKEQELREEIWSIKTEYDKRISQLIREKEELVLKISSISHSSK